MATGSVDQNRENVAQMNKRQHEQRDIVDEIDHCRESERRSERRSTNSDTKSTTDSETEDFKINDLYNDRL